MDSTKLISWMLDPYKRADGKIVFKRADQDSKMKEINFKEAYCVGYTENLDARRPNLSFYNAELNYLG